MALPNGYISLNGLWNSSGYYCDTGVVASSSLRVRGLFFIDSNSQNYVFGGRETNSTSSSKQFGFYANPGENGTGNSLVCYSGSRSSINDNGMAIRLRTYIENTNNEFLIATSSYLFSFTGTSTAFTDGTKNIYIGAMNSGGTVSYGSGSGRPMAYAFSFEKNGAILKEFTPAYEESSGNYGLYDLKNNVFVQAQGNSFANYHLLEVEATDGGTAFIKTFNAGNVTKQYCVAPNYGGDAFSRDAAKVVIKAVPKLGYEFINWTINDELYSNEDSIEYYVSEDTTIKANFRKITDYDAGTGFKLLGIKYASSTYPSSSADEPGRSADIYANIISMNLAEDGLTQSTSTIVCKEIPPEYQNDMIVFVLNPKGKIIFSGVIKSIEDKTLTVREALSIFDRDFLFQKFTTDMKKMNVAGVLESELSNASIGGVATNSISSSLDQYCRDFIQRKYTRVDASIEKITFNSKVLNYAPDRTEDKISNLESYAWDIFNEFGIYSKPTLYNYVSSTQSLVDKGIYRRLRFIVGQNNEDTLVLSDNAECITNVNVVVEDVETTLLIILNSTSTTVRGSFVMEKDGTITNTSLYTSWSDMEYAIAYNNLKLKIVSSDDNASTVIKQNLSSAMYNHKITFDVDIKNGMYRADEFQIGRRANFYYGGKLYSSIITAREFAVNENQQDIQSIKITLGKVRTKLTTKINMGKVKGHK